MSDPLPLIDALRSERSAAPSPTLTERVLRLKRLFDSSSIPNDRAGIRLFNFHARAEDSCSAFDMIDVTRDNRLIDYQAMRRHLIWCAEEFCKGSVIYLVSDPDTPQFYRSDFIVNLIVDIDPYAIMLERVIAMCAYVHSGAFRTDTVFLDTDAFPNSDLAMIFDGVFDIGLTYRFDRQVMPLNEGVIFASSRNLAAVQAFFRAYLAIFEQLQAAPVIKEHYGSIAHWRGGQLSLNVLALPVAWPLVADENVAGARVKFFRCEEFNYSPDCDLDPDEVEDILADKRIIHVKGQNKRHFLTARRHALGRLPARAA